MHIASNMFLRYAGGFVGSSEQFFAINLKSSNVTIIIKNGDERSITGFGIGSVLGRGNKLTVLSSDLNTSIHSTAVWVE